MRWYELLFGACSTTRHYLKQCLFIFNSDLVVKLRWELNWNIKFQPWNSLSAKSSTNWWPFCWRFNVIKRDLNYLPFGLWWGNSTTSQNHLDYFPISTRSTYYDRTKQKYTKNSFGVFRYQNAELQEIQTLFAVSPSHHMHDDNVFSLRSNSKHYLK